MQRLQDAGSSLVEVIIALMVLGLAGAAVVGAIFVSRSLPAHLGDRHDALTALDAAAQSVLIQPFAACATPLPYATPTSANPNYAYSLSATTVHYDAAAGSTSVPCDGTGDSAQQTMQIVKVALTVNIPNSDPFTYYKSVLKVRP